MCSQDFISEDETPKTSRSEYWKGCRSLNNESLNLPWKYFILEYFHTSHASLFYVHSSTFSTVNSMKMWCPFSEKKLDFYRATACNATHGIAVAILFVRPSVSPSVRLSVCPSHACIVTKLNDGLRAILIPHETAITLVFWHQHWLVGDAPFPVKYSPKVTHPLRKTETSTGFRSQRLNRKR